MGVGKNRHTWVGSEYRRKVQVGMASGCEWFVNRRVTGTRVGTNRHAWVVGDRGADGAWERTVGKGVQVSAVSGCTLVVGVR